MPRIRVATYNIHACVGPDRRFDPRRVLRVIDELDADVVALQEVESNSRGTDVLEFLTARTGMQAVAGPTMHRADGTFGNALLTRCRPVEVRRVDLSVPPYEPRGALDVVLDVHGVQVRVLATHFGLRPAERRHQARMLLARVAEDPMPVMLMGDMNEWFLCGRPLRWLHAEFRESPAPATFPARFPLFALDRLWVRPHHFLKDLSAHASPAARVASDHLPLLAVIEA